VDRTFAGGLDPWKNDATRIHRLSFRVMSGTVLKTKATKYNAGVVIGKRVFGKIQKYRYLQYALVAL
jgi:hypothetical protein